MVVRFKFGRLTGTVSLIDKARVEVHFPEQTLEDKCSENETPELDLLKRKIRSRLDVGKETQTPFREAGIPGTIVTYEEITYDNLIQAVEAIAHELGFWVWRDQTSIVKCPWFGTEGFTILYFNGNEDNPWFVVEDNATGEQAFCYTRDARYVWFDTRITETNLVKGWVDLEEFPINDLDSVRIYW